MKLQHSQCMISFHMDDFVAFLSLFESKNTDFDFLPGKPPKMNFFEKFLQIINIWVETPQKSSRGVVQLKLHKKVPCITHCYYYNHYNDINNSCS